MLIGYNQGTTLNNSDTETDLILAEKYGFNYIEFQMGPLYKYLKTHSLYELNEFFAGNGIRKKLLEYPKKRQKSLSLNIINNLII